jgi:hypothetical protein
MEEKEVEEQEESYTEGEAVKVNEDEAVPTF